MQGLGLRVWGIGFTVDTDSFLMGGPEGWGCS